MVTKTKKQVDEVNKMLKDKLEEMKELEQKVTATAAELEFPAIGVHKDEKGYYHIVKIKYDITKGAAVIDVVAPCNSQDYAIALYKAKEYLFWGLY